MCVFVDLSIVTATVQEASQFRKREGEGRGQWLVMTELVPCNVGHHCTVLYCTVCVLYSRPASLVTLANSEKRRK